MSNTRYAIVDLETTGNQVGYDEIIQIGISFVENHSIVDQYHSMVKTDLEIPTFIQALTSIEADMLDQAPYFKDIARQIYHKLENCIFVAHNVNFDLNFLQFAFKSAHIDYEPPQIIDTLELFKIAFPMEKSYQLSELADAKGIVLEQAHRADEDARTTAQLMIIAFKQLEQLPVETMKQLYFLSKHLKYQLDHYFFELVRQHKNNEHVTTYRHFNGLYYKPILDLKETRIQFEGDIQTLYQTIIDKAGYQYRETQLYMAETIYNQIMHSEKTLIEADTGSGKSLAYLIAALMFHIETGEHVMISTNTKLLQNQLLQHDIPMINRALNIRLHARMIKSKHDYISLGLVRQILEESTPNYEVNVLKMQLLIWILQTETGDIQELHLRGGQKMYFTQKVETYIPIKNDVHYYHHIKQNAQRIQIGVTNHAHLMYSSPDNSIYQLFNHCIIDEAHRLPDYAFDRAIKVVGYADIKYQLGLIGKTENEKLLRQLDVLEQQRIDEKLDIPPIDVFQIKEDIDRIHEENEHLFNVLFECAHQSKIYEDESAKTFYIYNLDSEQISKPLSRLIQQINLTLENFNSMKHATIKAIRKHLLYIRDMMKYFEKAIQQHQPFYLSLKNTHQKSTLKVHIKENKIKTILTNKVLNKFDSITFVSGTLTFNGSFDAYKKWFNNEAFKTFTIKPKVPLNTKGHLFIPSDIERFDYHHHDDYIQSIVSYIIEYAEIVQGKCLVLFTSYKMLYEVMNYLQDLEALEDYVILSQQPSQNFKIVQQFNHFDKAILLGTTMFFEGFDYQANGIKCVMITKLPFMSQYHAKPVLLKDEFDNIFKDYVLPEAVSRFKQGLGRLLRNEHDQGIVVSFDNRLKEQHYKHFFNEALEPFAKHYGTMNDFDKLLIQLQSKK
ncbi:DEAD/DEAH box helicase [Staphylococcus agnetis]|uniref:helicase C-terminal domain-containing protein n=1 Tax=Staphylococcus agnetis TaxID=985762 RepID=UPI000CD0CE7F|nr:helicase C-terminal domain-containing protein [Staphylococcus agnetis]NJH68502.1 DEAD/DEAH box helicase [Staphylococcus agnetis]NJH79908.1 DEAD/DEAH box helicase [Staphylococcus agnetis]PNY85439.1 ATP-dependent helicase [Staphylococcus agnetis]PTH68563.1 ATP-dependent helicase [Staphylococcus agnetis]TRW83806.1 DEAD/DEAH box helicase [Staphylococcus agnetis]